jgi:hypothetical protein
MLKLFIAGLILFIYSFSFSQESEKEYVDEIKYNYVVGTKESLNKAESLFKDAIVKYPDSKTLAKLSGLLEEEGCNIDISTSTKSTQQKNNTPIKQQQTTTQTTKKTSIPTDNSSSSSTLPTTVVKKMEISVDLKMNEQNKFSWNSEIALKGLKTTIIIETGSGASFQKDVTGSSSFKFKSGDTRFDGVKSKVKLIIENKEGIELKGSKEISVKTTC